MQRAIDARHQIVKFLKKLKSITLTPSSARCFQMTDVKTIDTEKRLIAMMALHLLSLATGTSSIGCRGSSANTSYWVESMSMTPELLLLRPLVGLVNDRFGINSSLSWFNFFSGLCIFDIFN